MTSSEFSETYRKYALPLASWIRRAFPNATLNNQDYEDIVAMTWEAAWKCRFRLADIKQPLQWLCAVARRKALEYLKWIGRIDKHGWKLQFGNSHPDARFVSVETFDALSLMNERQRTSLILHTFHGYQMKEIAQIAGLTLDMVRHDLINGRAIARKALSA